MLFSCCIARASRALTKSRFKMDNLQVSEPPHKKKKENIVQFVAK